MSASVCLRDTAVLQMALNPRTGVWSMMRELARAQAAAGAFRAVAFGLITDPAWPAYARADLRELGLPVYEFSTPRVFGTAQFLLQAFNRRRIEQWLADYARNTGARRIVVHCHNAWLSGVFLPLRARGDYHIRMVATFHGVNAAALRGQPVRRLIHRRVAQRLRFYGAGLTSVESASLPVAEELFGLAADSFAVVPNGVPGAATGGCPFLSGAEQFTVGFVGTLLASKGWELIAQAVQRLAERGRNIRLLLAGTGPDYQKAQEFAARHSDCVECLGRVERPQRNLMPRLDVLALLSSQEGLPMAIIEALSAGVPVISTAVGGIGAAVEHGRNGFLVERSAEALESKLDELYQQRGRLAALQSGAKEIFGERFEIGRIAQSYAAVYQRALD